MIQFVIPALKKWATTINSQDNFQIFRKKLQEILELEGNVPEHEMVRDKLLFDYLNMKIVEKSREFNVNLLLL